MSLTSGGLRSHVHQFRKNAGLGPTELARQAGMTRQALHKIESGDSVPSTAVALRLAQALGCRVDELFSLVPASVLARPIGFCVGTAQPGSRVRLARVGTELLAFAMSGAAGLSHPADGVITANQAPNQAQNTVGQVEVELRGDLELAGRCAVLIGCDPSLELLAAHTGQSWPDVHILPRPASSLSALDGLAAGEAHMAGIHLWDAESGQSNLPFVQRLGLAQPVHVFALWTWEQGLLVAAGNPRKIRGVADLRASAQPGQPRLINRDPGAGSRLMLDAWLAAAGFDRAQRTALPGYLEEVDTPLEAARRVQSGAADVAPGPRVAAQALGLDFVPLQTEHFDLVVPESHLGHPGVQALLTTAQSPPFLMELAALGGYDTGGVGQLRGVVA